MRRLVACLIALAGCSNEEEKPKGCDPTTCPFDDDGFERGPEVSLKNDLLADRPVPDGPGKLGVFRRACNFESSCHGRRSGKASLYLGPPSSASITSDEILLVLQGGDPIQLADGGMSEKVPRGIVHVKSKTSTDVDLVVPFEPQNSFLMRKIDGCFEGLEATCKVQSSDSTSGHPCGDRMPWGKDTLCEDERNLVRRWILQGALNN